MMTTRILVANVHRAEDGSCEVVAPAVGVWSGLPDPGTLLAPGSKIGTLRQLNRRFTLVLPSDAGGRVSGGSTGLLALPVGYGEALFRLVSMEQEPSAPAGSDPASSTGRRSDSGADARHWVVVAPTDGVFYTRPAPDAAPYVELGARIHRGEPVGLIEVMKTFNQIRYEVNGAPETAEVLEVHYSDGSEVQAGAKLVVVREPVTRS